MGTVKLAEVAKAAAGAPLLMFQLYVIKDRDFCRKLILGVHPDQFCLPCLISWSNWPLYHRPINQSEVQETPLTSHAVTLQGISCASALLIAALKKATPYPLTQQPLDCQQLMYLFAPSYLNCMLLHVCA